MLFINGVSQKRGLLSLLRDRAEQATSSRRPSLTLPTSSALGSPVWIQLQNFFFRKKKRLTTVCLTDSSCVSSGAAGKLTRKRHDIKSAAVVNICQGT